MLQSEVLKNPVKVTTSRDLHPVRPRGGTKDSLISKNFSRQPRVASSGESGPCFFSGCQLTEHIVVCQSDHHPPCWSSRMLTVEFGRAPQNLWQKKPKKKRKKKGETTDGCRLSCRQSAGWDFCLALATRQKKDLDDNGYGQAPDPNQGDLANSPHRHSASRQTQTHALIG